MYTQLIEDLPLTYPAIESAAEKAWKCGAKSPFVLYISMDKLAEIRSDIRKTTPLFCAMSDIKGFFTAFGDVRVKVIADRVNFAVLRSSTCAYCGSDISPTEAFCEHCGGPQWL